ncbi:hypothetical protein EV368DRAFT_69845 [Lentinula lateritia]|nr:hypothetical protein EV368DRAFT_69845 [Lentinula lateritia]
MVASDLDKILNSTKLGKCLAIKIYLPWQGYHHFLVLLRFPEICHELRNFWMPTGVIASTPTLISSGPNFYTLLFTMEFRLQQWINACNIGIGYEATLINDYVDALATIKSYPEPFIQSGDDMHLAGLYNVFEPNHICSALEHSELNLGHFIFAESRWHALGGLLSSMDDPITKMFEYCALDYQGALHTHTMQQNNSGPLHLAFHPTCFMICMQFVEVAAREAQHCKHTSSRTVAANTPITLNEAIALAQLNVLSWPTFPFTLIVGAEQKSKLFIQLSRRALAILQLVHWNTVELVKWLRTIMDSQYSVSLTVTWSDVGSLCSLLLHRKAHGLQCHMKELNKPGLLKKQFH